MNLKKEYSELLKKVEKEYLDNDGINGISLGYRYKENKLTREVCIRFYVSIKYLSDKVNPDYRIPKTVYGYPTDVIEGKFQEYHESSRFNCNTLPDFETHIPIIGGSMLQMKDGHLGTIGLVVFDLINRKPAILTNAHVVEGYPDGDPVFLGEAHKEQKAGNILRRFKGLSGNDIYIDAAVISVDDSVKITNEIIDLGEVLGINDLEASEELGLLISKRGRTSRLTRGVTGGIRSIQSGVTLERSRNCIEMDPKVEFNEVVSFPGDSGTVFLDDDNNAVGLLFAGLDRKGIAIACPISEVFKVMNIRLLDSVEVEDWNKRIDLDIIV